MGKRPSFQFYPGDWLKDVCLSGCSPQTRGIWIDLLCHIDQLETGEITGTIQAMSQRCRCTPAQMRKAIKELEETGTAFVQKNGKKITVHSKRMLRDSEKRRAEQERKNAERTSAKGNPSEICPAVVRDLSTPSSSSTSSSDIIHTQKADPHWPDPIIAELEKVWPEDARRSKAKIMESVSSAINASPDPDDARARMLKNAPLYLAECDREDRFVKHLQNWIADGDWSAEYSEKPNAASRSKKGRINKPGAFGQTFRATND